MHRNLKRDFQPYARNQRKKRKQRKVQNMPLIWRMSYHATNSSHVTNHFLSTLFSLRYMRCVIALRAAGNCA